MLKKVMSNPTIRLWCFYFVYLCWSENVLRLSTTGTFVTEALYLVPLFSIPFASLFTWIVTLSENRWYRLVCSVVLTLCLVIYFGAQIVYHNIFKTFFTVYSFLRMGQGLAFLDTTIEGMVQSAIPLALLALPLVIVWLFRSKIFFAPGAVGNAKFRTSRIKWEHLVLLSVGTHLLAVSLFGLSGDAPSSAYTQYYGKLIPNDAVNALGIITYTRLDLQSHFLPSNAFEFDFEVISTSTDVDSASSASSHTPDKAVADLVQDREIRGNFDAVSRGNAGTEHTRSKAPEYKPHVLEKLVFNQHADHVVISNLNKYFSNRKPSYENAYTGMFRGYNLILITAEGFSHLAINKELTPTLYRLSQEGVQFHNFYTPIWGVSTSDGEYVALQSLIPKAGVWSMANSSTNHLPQTLGNQLRAIGYQTFAYHNHYFNYYSRDLSHPNLGYDYKGLGSGLVVKETWPESDLEMMEVTAPEYMNETPFHAYYMTVSGHLGYSFGGNHMSAKNRHLVEHLAVSEQAKAYYACQIELDRAIAHLLSELEKHNLLDNTLIAMSADHYPYGLDYETMCELAGHEIEMDFELYKNAFLLYNPKFKGIEVHRYCSSFDILPTISNLLGLEYDSRLMMGRDVFSDDEVLIPFVSRSFLTDWGAYHASTGTFIPYSASESEERNRDNDGTEEYIKQKRAEVDAMFYVSEKILETDYFRILFLQK